MGAQQSVHTEIMIRMDIEINIDIKIDIEMRRYEMKIADGVCTVERGGPNITNITDITTNSIYLETQRALQEFGRSKAQALKNRRMKRQAWNYGFT